MRDALDYADETRFPVAKFGGPVTRSNTARLKKVVEAFSDMGAVLEDVVSATGGRHKSRGRRGINNAGWRIWPYNYGKWMSQLDPAGTSVGRWCVGDKGNLLGQTTQQTVPSKNMSFALAPGLFAKPAAARTRGLFVRVAYFDEGYGGWELRYASSKPAGSGMKLAARVHKKDTKQFIEIRVKLTDLDLNLSRGGGAHFALVDTDGRPDVALGSSNDGGWTSTDPDVFAWIEVLATEFLYSVAEVVHELGTVPAA